MKTRLLFIVSGILAILWLSACGSDVTTIEDGDTADNDTVVDGDKDESEAIVDGDSGETEVAVDGDDKEDADSAESEVADEESEQAPDGDTEVPIDGDTDTIVDGDSADNDTEQAETYACPSVGFTIKEGVNTVNSTLLGRNRQFTLITPNVMKTSSDPLPVIFFFHGSGDKMANWISAINLNSLVNNSEYPFIAVVPESLQLMPPTLAFDWDCLYYDSQKPNQNKDVNLFRQLYACVAEALPMNADKVHILGFSAGAIMTDLISMSDSDKIASVAAFSGAHFSDSAQEECLFGQCAQWLNIDAGTTPFPAFLAYGGTSDSYSVGGMMTMHFDVHAQDSITYLNENGHDVVACNHDSGHTITSSSFTAAMLFLKDHPRGTYDSPYATGIPASFPSYCFFNAKK